MQKISPGSISKEPSHSTSIFKRMEAVDMFLKACDVYEVQGICEAGDLVYNTNLWRFIRTVHELADRAAILGFTPVMQRKDNDWPSEAQFATTRIKQMKRGSLPTSMYADKAKRASWAYTQRQEEGQQIKKCNEI